MFRIFIQGMKDDEYKIEEIVPVEDVHEMYQEYIGKIKLEGKLRKLGNRYSLIANAKCNAKLVCDRSLKEYTDLIEVSMKLAFVTDDTPRGNFDNGIEEVIRTDDKYIDISNVIREVFAVNLPLKRIAPEIRNKELKELFPDIVDDSQNMNKEEIDERWTPLNKLKEK